MLISLDFWTETLAENENCANSNDVWKPVPYTSRTLPNVNRREQKLLLLLLLLLLVVVVVVVVVVLLLLLFSNAE